MRATAIAATVILAAVIMAGPALAKGATGKVASVDKDKVVLQLGDSEGANFPVGTRNVEIRSTDGVTLKGRVVAVTGDKVTFKIMRGKASSLDVGGSVSLEKIVRTGSEEMQGC